METLSYNQIPSPTPDGFARTVFAKGYSIVGTPNHWEVSNAAAVLSIFNAYVGSSDELAWAKSNIGGTGKLDQLNTIYLGKFAAGFNYTGPDAVKRVFQIDAASQFNIDVQANAALGAMINSVALVTVSGSGLGAEIWDANSYFIAADNSHMPLPTATDMRTFALAVRAYVSGLILHNRALKDAIGGATDVKTLDTIDINLGWPSNP